MRLKPGSILQNGKYEIVKVIGQGGFGITYAAMQTNLGCKVAVKEFFMKDCCERDAETSMVSVPTQSNRNLVDKFKNKFLREARMIARFDHPNIVRVTDVFEENGTAYYVMENLPGGSLSEKVENTGPIPEDEAEKYVRQVADALKYIHSQHTVHLDVKPSNVLLNARGEAVLIDFGISKHYDEAGEQTSSTLVGISKGYAPLEQSRDGDISQFKPSTDIYALGATLYHLVTGHVPPEASIVNEDGLDRPNGVSDRIWNAIEQAMQARRKDRPQSVEAFIAMLDSRTAPSAPVAEADPEGTYVPGKKATIPQQMHKFEPKAPQKPKTWLLATVGGIAVAAVIAAVVLGGQKSDKQEELSDRDSNNYYDNSYDDWVDLGLSVKWATCNVGASSPSDYGDYYAWGETATKSNYDWSTYKWCKESFDSLTKYNTVNSYGAVDNMKRLDREDDVANAKWGGTWRMPTDEEMTELREKCDWTWAKQGGKDGYRVTSRTNGNSIFLPAAGTRRLSSLFLTGSFGFYWSSSLSTSSDTALFMGFDSSGIGESNLPRCYGFSVRPVTE